MGAVHILVASYLYSIVEPKVEGLKWETMLVENHKRADRLSSRLRITYPITISIYAVFSIVCVFFSWLFLKDNRILNVLLYSCVTVILGVCFVLASEQSKTRLIFIPVRNLRYLERIRDTKLLSFPKIKLD